MATYQEIANLLDPMDTSGVREKVYVAALVKAEAIRNEVDDASVAVRERKRYSQQLFKQSLNIAEYISRGAGNALAQNSVLEAIYRAVLISNISAPVAAITGASDNAIQNAVNDAVDHLAIAYNDPDPVV